MLIQFRSVDRLLDHNLNALDVIDHQILRLVPEAQANSLVEMLYLERAELPVKSVISVRKLM